MSSQQSKRNYQQQPNNQTQNKQVPTINQQSIKGTPNPQINPSNIHKTLEVTRQTTIKHNKTQPQNKPK